MSFLPPPQLVYKLFVGGKIMLLVICWTSIKFVVVVVQLSKQSVFAADFTKIIELKKPCCTCQEPITDLLLNTPTLRIKRGTVFFFITINSNNRKSARSKVCYSLLWQLYHNLHKSPVPSVQIVGTGQTAQRDVSAEKKLRGGVEAAFSPRSSPLRTFLQDWDSCFIWLDII